MPRIGRQFLATPIVLGVVACATYIPRPTIEMAHGSAVRLDELQSGFELYRAKCSGCHALHPVNQYSAQQWPQHVDEMVDRKKVRFEAGDRERLLEYLCAAAER